MAEANPPWALQNVSTLQANQARKLVEALVGSPGVAEAAALAVTQNGTPNMSVNVAAGAGFVAGTTSPLTQGVYHMFSDSVVNKPLAASNATNPRIDLIVARVQDSFYAGTVDAWDLVVVTGSPAATPVAPAVPASSLVLAEVLVDAAVTSVDNSKITDRRTRAAGSTATPRGKLVESVATASTTATTTTEVVWAALTKTVIVPPGPSRRLRVTARIVPFMNGAASGEFKVKEGAAVLQGALHTFAAAGGASATVVGEVVAAPGTHTFSVSYRSQSGAVGFYLYADATFVSRLTVDDIGV